MSPWQSGFVDAPQVRLHYTRAASDRPAFVLVHGFSDDGLCWSPVAEAFSKDFDVIMPDMRGHGRSGAPDAGYGPREHVEDLHAIIEMLGLVQPIVLGHSMGAVAALAYAGSYPDRISTLLLEDPPAIWMLTPPADPQRDAERVAGRKAWITGLQAKTRAELIHAQHADSPVWSDAELGPWADAKLRFNLRALDRHLDAPIDWATILSHVACPALLITGDPDRGALVTESHADALVTQIPQLQVRHVPGAGHSIRRDQFQSYCRAVRDFLASTPV
jgi:pimeloyl-ACP methyl ester carboxylesterase